MRALILVHLLLLLCTPLCAGDSGLSAEMPGAVFLPLPVPDNDPGGVLSRLLISGCDTVEDLDVSLEVDHQWVGDLVVTLVSPRGTKVTLVDRPGIEGSEYGCGFSGLSAVLDDEAVLPVQDQCADDNGGTIPAIHGVFRPAEPLSAFDGELGSGIWTLRVSDWAEGHTGKLRGWQLGLDCRSHNVDLQPQLLADAHRAETGDKVILTLQLSNGGSDSASGVEAVYELPPGMECDWAESGALAEGQQVTQRFGTLTPGERIESRLGVIITADRWGWLNVVARIRAEQTDTNPGNDVAHTNIYVGPGPVGPALRD